MPLSPHALPIYNVYVFSAFSSSRHLLHPLSYPTDAAHVDPRVDKASPLIYCLAQLFQKHGFVPVILENASLLDSARHNVIQCAGASRRACVAGGSYIRIIIFLPRVLH